MDFISNPNLPNILLKAERRDNLIAIQTYDRAHGRKGRFLICMDALQAWLDGDRERPFYDSDCGNFLVLRLYGGFCKMQLFWLSEYGSGDLHGLRQDVEIPENQLLTLMQGGTPICRLCKPQTGMCALTPAPAHESFAASSAISANAAHSAKPCGTISAGRTTAASRFIQMARTVSTSTPVEAGRSAVG